MSVAWSTVAIMMDYVESGMYIYIHGGVYTYLGIQVIFVDSQPVAGIMHALQRHHLWATYMDLELS